MISSENALLRAYFLMNVRGRYPMSFVEEASKVVAQKVSVFIIPCLNAWHKEHTFKKALKQDPGLAETGILV